MHERNCTTPTVSRLEGALALLDARSRHIMELWLEGESVAEIAEIIGLPERAVAVIRGASIWRLRELIAQEPCPGEADLPLIKPK